jgi:multicomponent Na+:H+ antiporter subunit G
MVEIAIMVVSAIGSVFILLAAIGIVRMPDLYLRISVTTKAATLGIGLILTGAALFFADFSVTSRVIAIVFFLLLTAPVAVKSKSRGRRMKRERSKRTGILNPALAEEKKAEARHWPPAFWLPGRNPGIAPGQIILPAIGG